MRAFTAIILIEIVVLSTLVIRYFWGNSGETGPVAVVTATAPVVATTPTEEPEAVESTAAGEPRTPAETDSTTLATDPSVPVPTSPVAGGLLTFRGNPQRSFYGTGPIPDEGAIQWIYSPQRLCGLTTIEDEESEWCGTGWTGQPAVVERDGRTWVVFGAYDHSIHFVDAATGEPILEPFETDDIIKGSVTIDPNGFPIVYSGSRDGYYRAIAIDGTRPRELWSLSSADATGPTRWNDDWDGSGLIINDRLVTGGENSRIFVVKLNRAYNSDGLVTMDPEVVWDAPGWDRQLDKDLPDNNVSIENSVTMVDDTVYFSNSGGLVQGWDLSPLDRGEEPVQTFRWWIGDDTDASIVADAEGYLYVSAEYERFNARSREVGQVVKLDPRRPEDPLIWSFHDPRATNSQIAGIWGTPALYGQTLIVPTTGGDLYGLDTSDGSEQWILDYADHLWSSPVVVDNVLVQGDCQGALHAYDLNGTAVPVKRWQLQLDGCIESTPAAWAGQLFVGARGGAVYAINERG